MDLIACNQNVMAVGFKNISTEPDVSTAPRFVINFDHSGVASPPISSVPPWKEIAGCSFQEDFLPFFLM